MIYFSVFRIKAKWEEVLEELSKNKEKKAYDGASNGTSIFRSNVSLHRLSNPEEYLTGTKQRYAPTGHRTYDAPSFGR